MNPGSWYQLESSTSRDYCLSKQKFYRSAGMIVILNIHSQTAYIHSTNILTIYQSIAHYYWITPS